MEIDIKLSDGEYKKFPSGVTSYEIAAAISPHLAKQAIIAEINGEITDLSAPIYISSQVKILTSEDPLSLDIIRHDAAHITAQAVKEIFPNIQITIGPTIKDGFYYDFAKDSPFTEKDLELIEARMKEIIKKDYPFIREECDRDKAIKLFREMGEHYKVEIINSIDKNAEITLYHQGNFVDLCRGPHGPSTGKIKYFKLIKVAGAYWRGDVKNPMLQRIYGTAWPNKDKLSSYLKKLKEAAKRDHRKIGKELKLFHFQEEAQGMVFWHQKGFNIYKIIEIYIRNKLHQEGYIEVKTPLMIDKTLWQKSGHWDKFRQNMFILNNQEQTNALKPMNCPCHVEIFKQQIKSYRDLPIRMAEFGICHRNESSGALHGLMRVRSFTQDDAHIFCTEEQINSETIKFCRLLINIYKDFGFTKIKIKFSDRPQKKEGSDEIWDKAELALKKAIKEAGLNYELNKGEGAFYGPKIEFTLIDALEREWQCGTLQVDFVLPEKLGAKYIDSNNKKRVPIMLHRAILGTFERFIGLLIEEYSGEFPIWLAPIQVVVVGVNNQLDDYILQINKELINANIRSEVDLSREKLQYKIRYFSYQKVPIIAVVGPKEMESKTLTLRSFGNTNNIIVNHSVVTIKQLINIINKENKKYIN